MAATQTIGAPQRRAPTTPRRRTPTVLSHDPMQTLRRTARTTKRQTRERGRVR
jgi:hypothetical protein